MAQAAQSGKPHLFAADDGGGEEALVLLHGFGGSHAVWDGIRAGLADRIRPSGRIRTIAFDLPGHGGSLAFGAVSPKAAARAVLDELARRGVEKAHLAGHSMGGAIAILAALAEPARIASLTLLSPGGIGPQINGAVLQRFAAATTPAEVALALAAMSAPGAAVDPRTAEALAALRAVPGQTEVLVELAGAISADDRQGAFPTAMLAGLACPLAIAWGRADPVLPFAQTANLPAGARLVAIDGAGHMLIEEAPALVGQLIAAALS